MQSKSDLKITIPSDDYIHYSNSIREEGQGSFKIQEQFAGKKRKAEAFLNDLPQQPHKMADLKK